MVTARGLLREGRLQQKFSLSEISWKIKIPEKYLAAIEEGQNEIFPNYPYAQLYVRDYAKFLGLPTQRLVSLFRRDWEGATRSEALKTNRQVHFLQLSPFLTRGGLLIFLVVAAAIAYLARQYFVFKAPPSFTLDVSCLPGRAVIKGKTNSQNIIRIDDQPVLLDKEGNFGIEMAEPLPNQVRVEAESPSGIQKQQTLPLSCSSGK